MARHGYDVVSMLPGLRRHANVGLRSHVDDVLLLIHTWWKRNITEQRIGEPSTAHETFVKRGRTQELPGQVPQCRIPGSHETEGIDRRGEPKASRSKEGRETLLEKDLKEVLGRVRFVS